MFAGKRYLNSRGPQSVAQPPTHEASHLNLREDGTPTPRRAWELQLSRLICLQQSPASFSKVAPEIKGEQCVLPQECSHNPGGSQCPGAH